MKKLTFGVLAGLLIGAMLGGGYLAAESSHRNSIMGTGARRNNIEFEFVEPSAGSAMNLVPGATNTNALGTSGLRWSNVATTGLDVSGAASLSGTTTLSRANVSVQLSTAPRTSTTLIFNSTGTLVFNTTDNYLCISTSANQNSFVIVSTISNNVASAH